MKLLNPSDAELNAAFAEKVAGWRKQFNDGWLGEAVGEGRNPHMDWFSPEDGFKYSHHELQLPPFTASADAVLPWLEKLGFWACQYSEGLVVISDDHMDCNSENMSSAETFPKAAVIALLRAHGVEVEFTQ